MGLSPGAGASCEEKWEDEEGKFHDSNKDLIISI